MHTLISECMHMYSINIYRLLILKENKQLDSRSVLYTH